MTFRIPFKRTAPVAAPTTTSVSYPTGRPPERMPALAGVASRAREVDRSGLRQLPAPSRQVSSFTQTFAPPSLPEPRPSPHRPIGLPGQMTPLEQAVRKRLPSLDANDARRFEGLLNHLLRSGDLVRKATLLKMVDAKIATKTPYQNDVASVRTSQVQAPSKETVSVQFQGVVTEMSASKETQLTALRLEILKLPPALAKKHHELLRDILRSKNPVRRDMLITSMAKQIEQSKAREWTMLQLRFNILKLPQDRATRYTTLLGDILARNNPERFDLLFAKMAEQVAQEVSKRA